MEKDLAYKLGLFIGERIISNSIPYLDDYGNNANRLAIQITDSNDFEKLHNLNDEALKNYLLNNKDVTLHQDFLLFRRELVKKYLPHEISCPIIEIFPIDDSVINDLKNGIRTLLWDSDICEYNIDIDNIILEKGDYGFDYVTLKLDL